MSWWNLSSLNTPVGSTTELNCGVGSISGNFEHGRIGESATLVTVVLFFVASEMP